MFSEKEVINATFDELLDRFKKIVKNEGSQNLMYRPSSYDDKVKDEIQIRLPDEINSAHNNIVRLNQLLEVAQQLYRSDLANSAQDRLRELQAIKIH